MIEIVGNGKNTKCFDTIIQIALKGYNTPICMHFDGEELKQLEKIYNIKIEEEKIVHLSDAGGVLYKVGKEELDNIEKIRGKIASPEVDNMINCIDFPKTWKRNNRRNINPKTI